MRQIEFEKLRLGDIVYTPPMKDEPWTVTAYYPRHETFLLLSGRHKLTRRIRRLRSIVVRLPDRFILEIADQMDVRICRVFDPQKWEKEIEPS